MYILVSKSPWIFMHVSFYQIEMLQVIKSSLC